MLPGVSVSDYEHWGRGRSDDCVIRIGEAGREILGVDAKDDASNAVVARYANGPLLAIKEGASSAATFASDFTTKSTFGKRRRGADELARGVMPRHSAVVVGDALTLGPSAGRVALISPHLEDAEPAACRFLRALLRWAGKRPSRDRPPDADVAAAVRSAWLACRKARYAQDDVSEDRRHALRALLVEEKTRRRRAEAAREVARRGGG